MSFDELEYIIDRMESKDIESSQRLFNKDSGRVEAIADRPIALSIAGFDPSGGAGILADIKTFEEHKVYGVGVITANTVQNHSKFSSVNWIDKDIVEQQLDTLFEVYDIRYIKIGLIHSLDYLDITLQYIRRHSPDSFIVWDPVLSATAGFSFHSLESEDISNPNSMLNRSLSNIDLVTPNLDEFSLLFPGLSKDSEEIKEFLNSYCPSRNLAILLKGGHSSSDIVCDTYISREITIESKVTRSENESKHGTGCILSSAFTANIANGLTLNRAVCQSQEYVSKIINFSRGKLALHNR